MIGKFIVKLTPIVVFDASIVPSCASIIFLVIANPNPLPDDFVVKNGLNIFSILIGSSDFKDDVKISNHALDIAQEQYRKFFNVLRYLCAVVEYKDSIQEVEIEEELEKCILLQLREIIEKYIHHMEAFEIHSAFNCVKEFIMYIFDKQI